MFIEGQEVRLSGVYRRVRRLCGPEFKMPGGYVDRSLKCQEVRIAGVQALMWSEFQVRF